MKNVKKISFSSFPLFSSILFLCFSIFSLVSIIFHQFIILLFSQNNKFDNLILWEQKTCPNRKQTLKPRPNNKVGTNECWSLGVSLFITTTCLSYIHPALMKLSSMWPKGILSTCGPCR